MSNHYLTWALRKLRDLHSVESSRAKRTLLKDIIDDVEQGRQLSEQQIYAAKMFGLRNPDFPDDWIGRWDDDYGDEDDEDKNRLK